jgi:hypothetical protein
MSIESRHAYRFGFLRSDKWKALRLERLVRDGAKCRLCGKHDLSNDVHHWKYPENWNDTKVWHLKTLCRECHDDVHEIMKSHPELGWKQIKCRVNRIGHVKKLTPQDHIKSHIVAVKETQKKIKRLTVLVAWVIHLRLLNLKSYISGKLPAV